jgi:hypothetical protein
VTRPSRPARAWAAAAAWSIFLLATGVAPVLAAVNGRLEPGSARPGEWVELTTVDGGDPNVYAPIAAAGPLPVFLQRAATQSAGNGCDTPVGSMTWADGLGTLRFQVPPVDPGTYWILAAVQGGCWRFGDGAGVLTLTVLPSAGGGVSLLILVGAIVGGAAMVVAAILLVRHSRPRE